jgi:hypothetical protein
MSAAAPDLRTSALALRSSGLSVLPIDHNTKKPHNDLLPRDDAGKPVWDPFKYVIVDPKTVRGWCDAGLLSVGVVAGAVSGGLLVLDFDVERLYAAWCALVGDLADGLPVQRTGGGGYQVFLRCPNSGGNEKLAWVEDEREGTGRTIGIETRGEGGYAVVPPSLHPSGARYAMISGDLTAIPTISQARADALVAAARKLDEAPYTRQERQRLGQQAADLHRRRVAAAGNGSIDVIGRFNQSNTVEALLERHGYVRSGSRYVRPGGTSRSVSVRDGRSCHFSTNDPLNDGKVKSGMGCHDAFDVYCHYAHGGDLTAAVRAAAEAMGIKDARRRNPAGSTPRADDTRGPAASGEVPSVSAPKGNARGRVGRAEPFRPFPTDLLPYPMAKFIHEAAAAIGCDESFIALPLLVGLATAIGTTRRVRIKWDWGEYPIIWAVLVASSGQRKTPAFYAALQPLHDIQRGLIERHRAEMEEYKRQHVEYKAALAEYKQRGEGEPPEEPQKPGLKRVIVNDTTIEALAMLLEENPRGLGVHRDELSGWLASHNQYKAGRGADASQWLELHRGGLLIVDRKTSERRMIYVPRAAASICGTIQPGVIGRGYGREQFENGMVARTLFAMPPARQRAWTDRSVEPHTLQRVADVYRALLELDFDAADNPIDVPLSEEARGDFARFVDEHGAEQARLGDEGLEAAWSKLEGYAARLALIVHLVRRALDDDSADLHAVDRESVRVGVALARWFGHEARRVYADMGLSDEDRQRQRLVALVQGKGGRITPRDLTRNCRRYATTEDAELALGELVGLRLGKWEHPAPGPSGGRPQKYFVLSSLGADTDETEADATPGEVTSAREAPEAGCVGAADTGDDLDALIDREERAAIQEDGDEGVERA